MTASYTLSDYAFSNLTLTICFQAEILKPKSQTPCTIIKYVCNLC